MSMIVIDGKEVPLLKAKSKTTIKNKESGVVYKDDQEWKRWELTPRRSKETSK